MSNNGVLFKLELLNRTCFRNVVRVLNMKVGLLLEDVIILWSKAEYCLAGSLWTR